MSIYNGGGVGQRSAQVSGVAGKALPAFTGRVAQGFEGQMKLTKEGLAPPKSRPLAVRCRVNLFLWGLGRWGRKRLSEP